MAFSSICTIVSLWPFPKECSQNGDSPSLYKVNVQNFDFEAKGSLRESTVFKKASKRILDVIQAHEFPTPSLEANSLEKLEVSLEEGDVYFFGDRKPVDIPLHYGVDESYRIEIKRRTENPDDGLVGKLRAKTIYGAMHGLQTFSQLIERRIDNEIPVTEIREIMIFDEPKFPHRGILIDTSRHYESVPTIKKLINLLSMNKLNVLHWHVVDIQSYPIEGPRNEGQKNFLDGAYDMDQVYSMRDVRELMTYAEERGVRIIAEFDMPGHTDSWGKSHPELFPELCNAKSKIEAFGALEPKKETYDMINEMFKFYTSEGFSDEFLHLGGDEVPYKCWQDLITPTRKVEDIFSEFLNKVHQLAQVYKKQVIWWDEAFFGLKEKNATLPRDSSVIQVWHEFSMVPTVADAGFSKIILSPAMGPHNWYLDHLDIGWEDMYNLPIETLDSTSMNSLIGGEGCMWGERVDDSNIFARAFPRMSAIAERLWTFSKEQDPTQRFASFRCQMIARGFPVGQLTHHGDTDVNPAAPSSCSAFADHTSTKTTTKTTTSSTSTTSTSTMAPSTSMTPTTTMTPIGPLTPSMAVAARPLSGSRTIKSDDDTIQEDLHLLDPHFQQQLHREKQKEEESEAKREQHEAEARGKREETEEPNFFRFIYVRG